MCPSLPYLATRSLKACTDAVRVRSSSAGCLKMKDSFDLVSHSSPNQPSSTVILPNSQVWCSKLHSLSSRYVRPWLSNERKRIMHSVKRFGVALCFVAVFGFALPKARADEWNKQTKMTFTEAFEVPGMVLPAGTYTFALADSNSDR